MEQTYKIGTIPVESPSIGYGTYHLLDKCNASDAIQTFSDAYDVGVRLFDSSDNYGTELVLGRAISAGALPREHVIVATKTGLGTTLHEQREWTKKGYRQDTSPERIHRQVNNSLLLLGADVEIIDLYQLHVYDDRHPHIAHASTMNELIEQGKIREYGLSNYSHAELQDFLEVCDAHSLRRPAAVQPYYNMLSVDTESSVDLARQEGIVVLAHSPLLKGALADKRQADIRSVLDKELKKDLEPQDKQYVDALTSVWNDIAELSLEAKKHKRSLSQLSTAWVVRQSGVISLNAVTNPKYLSDTVQAADWDYTKSETLSHLVDKLRQKPEAAVYASAMQHLMRQIRRY